MSNDTTAISADTRNAIPRAMVDDIGTSPQKDPHFWSYEGQEFWGPQSYAQSIIRKYVDLKGGPDARWHWPARWSSSCKQSALPDRTHRFERLSTLPGRFHVLAVCR